MSQAYEIRRRGQIYIAPHREALAQWAAQGRVRLDDEVRPQGHEGTPWRRFEEDQELKALFPYAECHVLKRGEQRFKAHGFELICAWARAGKVSLSDEVYLPDERAWRAVSLIPQLRELIEPRVAASPLPSTLPSLTAEQLSLITAPLYDVARLYIAYLNSPVGEPLASPSVLQSFELDAGGIPAAHLFELIYQKLSAHHRGVMARYGSAQLGASRTEREQAQLSELERLTGALLTTLQTRLAALGLSAPERLVVGSEPSAQRHPDEREALEALRPALAQVIRRAAQLRRGAGA